MFFSFFLFFWVASSCIVFLIYILMFIKLFNWLYFECKISLSFCVSFSILYQKKKSSSSCNSYSWWSFPVCFIQILFYIFILSILFFSFFFFLQVWLTIKSPPLTCLFILFLFCFLVWFSFYKWVVWDMGDPTRKTFKLKCDIHQWTEGTKISKTLFWYFNFISFDVLLFSVMFTFI